ncbi:hypothetical protein SKAU_G00359800 [Synaphobranchus kaupii]|uniref:Uncharacterized protein n=1 Tax=Synaphobranchus kaupii TaxID=118154 RepID=A0A9Q1IH02_SYNKA|nr:hypothetical protein SKAU_G00359800 [Synaphobranchus kaupii]
MAFGLSQSSSTRKTTSVPGTCSLQSELLPVAGRRMVARSPAYLPPPDLQVYINGARAELPATTRPTLSLKKEPFAGAELYTSGGSTSIHKRVAEQSLSTPTFSPPFPSFLLSAVCLEEGWGRLTVTALPLVSAFSFKASKAPFTASMHQRERTVLADAIRGT